MFGSNVLRMGLRLTAVLTAVLATSHAMAQQQGWPLNPGYNGFSESRSTYAPAYQPAPMSGVFLGAPATASSTGQNEIRSFYPSAAGEEYGALSTQAAGNQPVWINVSVPANAQILFGTDKMAQGGTRRAFVSPPLARGHDYTYDITVKWQQEGREVVRTRRITVHAGDVVNLSF